MQQWETLLWMAIGAAFAVIGERVKSGWDNRNKTKERRKRIVTIMDTLVAEIEDGIGRCVGMAGGNKSLEGIYTGWWTLVGPEVAACVKDVEILQTVNRIYSRFEPVNLNIGSTEGYRVSKGNEYAKRHLADLADDLNSLKERLKAKACDWVR